MGQVKLRKEREVRVMCVCVCVCVNNGAKAKERGSNFLELVYQLKKTAGSLEDWKKHAEKKTV